MVHRRCCPTATLDTRNAESMGSQAPSLQPAISVCVHVLTGENLHAHKRDREGEEIETNNIWSSDNKKRRDHSLMAMRYSCS